MADWKDLSDDEQLLAVEYAFKNATEIDMRRFHKICEWSGDTPLFMNLPQWVMIIFNRSVPDASRSD